MARKKKFKNAAALLAAWTKYKKKCDGHTVMTRTKEGDRTREIEMLRPITYTIDGFCVENKITRQAFYKTYGENEEYADVIEYMKEESETDARVKFETGQLPSKLAGLWMARYGYASKPATSDEREEVPRFEDF